MDKIKNNGVWCAILDDFHIMYMLIALSENLETSMIRGRNKIIESFTQHLLGDSWTQYFWTYYFQVVTWINFQSIIVVAPCYAYMKIFTLWIKVKSPMMNLVIPCEYCVFCCRFMDGGASTSATFKPRHININWVLPWGIENIGSFWKPKGFGIGGLIG